MQLGPGGHLDRDANCADGGVTKWSGGEHRRGPIARGTIGGGEYLIFRAAIERGPCRGWNADQPWGSRVCHEDSGYPFTDIEVKMPPSCTAGASRCLLQRLPHG